MSDYCERTTLSSERHGVVVTVEREFEHHMGASTVYLVCSPPIDGVGRFQTTNGYARMSEDGGHLLLCDSQLCVCVDLATRRAAHLTAPAKAYFSGLRCESGVLQGEIYRPHEGRSAAMAPIVLAEVGRHFSPGLGSAKNGRFPSACDV